MPASADPEMNPLPEQDRPPIMDRIDRRLRRLGLTDRAASIAAGRSADLIRTIRRQHLTGRQHGVSMGTLVNLAKVLRTTPQWLIDGTEPEELANGTEPKDLDRPEMGDRKSSLAAKRALYRQLASEALRHQAKPKLAGEIAAGIWRDQELPQARPALGIPIDPRYPAHYQSVFEVRDNSMDRLAQIGDFLIVVDRAASGLTPRSGDIVIVRRIRDGLHEVTARRFELRGSEVELRFESTDRHYATVTRMPAANLDGNLEFSIDGVVRAVYRRLA
jgi:Peptidase S24-like